MAGKGRDQILVSAAALGAICGIRSMAGPALLARGLAGPDGGLDPGIVERLLASEGTAKLLALMAGGEMLADKSSLIPDRTNALPLAGRALMGSLTAGAYAIHHRRSALMPAAVGAAAAVVATFAAFHLRRFASEELNVPDRLMGLIEDGILVAVGKRIGRSIEN